MGRSSAALGRFVVEKKGSESQVKDSHFVVEHQNQRLEKSDPKKQERTMKSFSIEVCSDVDSSIRIRWSKGKKIRVWLRRRGDSQHRWYHLDKAGERPLPSSVCKAAVEAASVLREFLSKYGYFGGLRYLRGIDKFEELGGLRSK